MKNSKTLFQELTSKLLPGESREEVNTMAYIILEEFFQLSKTDILSEKPFQVNQDDSKKLQEIVERLNRHEPLQYILGKAFFYGRSFKVSPAVLIPRPETEILVSIAKKWLTNPENRKKKLLDIGSGSGCIAVTLALELPHVEVYASDISPDALGITKENAAYHKTEVHLMHHSILKQDLPFSMFDVIVSNPPYIRENEKAEMGKNVVEYEPPSALFVPDNEPLIFYQAIAKKAAFSLLPNGLLGVEINETFGREVRSLFESEGFSNVEIIRDLSSKDRIVTGRKS